MCGLNLERRILDKILHEVDNRDIPWHLLQPVVFIYFFIYIVRGSILIREKNQAHDFDAFTHFQYHTEYENVFLHTQWLDRCHSYLVFKLSVIDRCLMSGDSSSEKKGPSQRSPKSNFDFLEKVVTVLVIFQ
jgi:hypothetical protein